MSDFPSWYARTYSTPGHEVAMCCICFTSLTTETCAVDENGEKWDVCKGDCAKMTGLVEQGSTPEELAAWTAESRRRMGRTK